MEMYGDVFFVCSFVFGCLAGIVRAVCDVTVAFQLIERFKSMARNSQPLAVERPDHKQQVHASASFQLNNKEKGCCSFELRFGSFGT